MSNTVVRHNFPIGAVLKAGDYEYTVCEKQDGITAHRFAPPDAVLVSANGLSGATYYSYLFPNEIDSVVSGPDEAEDAARMASFNDEGYHQDDEVAAVVSGGFNYDLANLAKEYGRVLTFQYAKTDKAPIEQRSVRPDTVYEDRHGDLLIVGPCPDRNDRVRAFRIDRIVGEASL